MLGLGCRRAQRCAEGICGLRRALPACAEGKARRPPAARRADRAGPGLFRFPAAPCRARPRRMARGRHLRPCLSLPSSSSASSRAGPHPAAFTAGKGRYNLENEQVAVDGPIVVTGPNNYRLETNDVMVDLNSKKLQSQKNVQGTMSLGTYAANGMHADLEARTVTLDGRA